ncbi:MAG: glucosamine-6-phosphate deaminase [Clostridiaceae bacterium]
MKIIICENYQEMSKKAASIIASQIILKPDSVLGLATGSTPVGIYENLIKSFKEGHLDFSQITTYNLDEYYGLPGTNPQSYRYFMDINLFNHVNINKYNNHVPNGLSENTEGDCAAYDEAIKASGGIDIQVLGIGSNGHIGFNEPGESFEKCTHLIDLKEETIEANSRFFNSIEEVPTKALTMGIGNIMKSKKILLLASGASKAEAIYHTVHSKVQPEIPSTILQFHNDVTIIVDKEAAKKL